MVFFWGLFAGFWVFFLAWFISTHGGKTNPFYERTAKAAAWKKLEEWNPLVADALFIAALDEEYVPDGKIWRHVQAKIEHGEKYGISFAGREPGAQALGSYKHEAAQWVRARVREEETK